MSIHYILTLMFLCFSHYISAQPCHLDTLNQGELADIRYTHTIEDGERFAVVALDDIFEYRTLTITKKDPFAPFSLEVYTDDPCDAAVSPSSTLNIDNAYLVYSLQADDRYFKIISENGNRAQVKIEKQVKQSAKDCGTTTNKYNRIDNPTLLNIVGIGQSCFDFCNTDCYSMPQEKANALGRLPHLVRWMSIDIDYTHMIAEMGINSSDLDQPRVIRYGVRGDNLFYIDDNDLSDNIIIQSYDYETLLIGVYDAKGATGDFSLCIEKLEIKTTCANFFREEGQDISAVYTSKGSPIEGPYLYGEKVTFRYQLYDWMPIKENWFHGLALDHGLGWKGLLRDEENELITLIPSKEIEDAIDTIYTDSYLSYTEEDTTRIEGITPASLSLPGWYYHASNYGPSGKSSAFLYGQPLKYLSGTSDTSQVELYFTMVADSTEDCSAPLDGFISLYPLSDYESGKWHKRGCVSESPVEQNSYVSCCSFIVEHSFIDTTMCHAETIDFSAFTDTDFQYQLLYQSYDTYQMGTIYGPNEIFNAINNFDQADTVGVQIMWESPEGDCTSYFDFEIIIKANGQSRSLVLDDFCMNEDLNISKELNRFSNDDIPVDPSLLDLESTYYDPEGDLWTHVVSKKRYTLDLESATVCYTDFQLQLDPEPCEKLEELVEQISFRLTPNPTTGIVSVIIENNTDYTSGDIIIFDDDGNRKFIQKTWLIAHSRSSKQLNLSDLSSGKYTVSLYVSGNGSSKKLIITK